MAPAFNEPAKRRVREFAPLIFLPPNDRVTATP